MLVCERGTFTRNTRAESKSVCLGVEKRVSRVLVMFAERAERSGSVPLFIFYFLFFFLFASLLPASSEQFIEECVL